MNIFSFLQITISLLLIVAVIFQNRGEGAMSIGGGEAYRSKRGLEKFLFYTTIALGIIFASLSILSLLLRQ